MSDSQVTRWAGAPLDKVVATCQMIADDMAADVTKWDGQIATGAAIAEMHGEMAAAVAVLSEIVAGLAVKYDRASVA